MPLELVLYVAAAMAVLTLISQLRQVQAKLDQLLSLFGVPGNGPREPSAAVAALAAAGQHIDAMRRYRQETGADVREAMKVVEALAQPEMPAKPAEPGHKAQ